MQKSVQERCVELCFGFFQRIGYTKTANCLLEESECLSKSEYRKIRVNDGPDGKEQFVISFNDRVHDKALEEIIEMFIQDGRFDVSREMLQFGEELRSIANRFTTMIALPNGSKSINHQRLYGRPSHSRHLQPTVFLPSSPHFPARSNTNFSAYTIQQSPHARAQIELQMINQQAELRYKQQQHQQQQPQQQLQHQQESNMLMNGTQNVMTAPIQEQTVAATCSSSQLHNNINSNDDSFDRHGSSKRKTHQPQSLNTMAKENLIDPIVGIINEKPWESVSDINLDDPAIFQSLDCIGKDFLATFDFAHNEYPQYAIEPFENGNLIPIDNEVVIDAEMVEAEPAAEDVDMGSEQNLNIEQGPPVLSPIQKIEEETPVNLMNDRVESKKKEKEKEKEREKDTSPKRKESSSSSSNVDRKQRDREKESREDRRRPRNHEGTPSSSSRRSHSPQSRRNDGKTDRNRAESTASKNRKDTKRRDRDERKSPPPPTASKKRPYQPEEKPSTSSRNESKMAKKGERFEKSSNGSNHKTHTESNPNPPKRVASPKVAVSVVPEKVPETNPKNKLTSNLLNKYRMTKNTEQNPAAPPKTDVFGDINRQMEQFEKKTPDELQAKKNWKIPKKSSTTTQPPAPANTPSPSGTQAPFTSSSSNTLSKSSATTSRMTPPSSEISGKREKTQTVSTTRNNRNEPLCEGDPEREMMISFIEPKMTVHRLTALLVNVNEKYQKIQKTRTNIEDDISRSPSPDLFTTEDVEKIEEVEENEEISEDVNDRNVPVVNTHPKTVGYAPQKGALFAKVMASKKSLLSYSDDDDEEEDDEDDTHSSPGTSPVDETSPPIRKPIDLNKASDVLDKLHHLYD